MALESCPLHYDDPFSERWKIPMKPDFAGVRILSLDGYAFLLLCYMRHI